MKLYELKNNLDALTEGLHTDWCLFDTNGDIINVDIDNTDHYYDGEMCFDSNLSLDAMDVITFAISYKEWHCAKIRVVLDVIGDELYDYSGALVECRA